MISFDIAAEDRQRLKVALDSTDTNAAHVLRTLCRLIPQYVDDCGGQWFPPRLVAATPPASATSVIQIHNGRGHNQSARGDDAVLRVAEARAEYRTKRKR
jgi:hypothetical protein